MPEPTYGVIELADGSRVLIDCTVSETVTREAEITQYAVESGGTVSDNIRARPLTIQIEGIISNTPLDPIARVRTGSGMDRPAKDMRERLEQAFDAKDVVTVIISTGKYSSMGIQHLEFPRDNQTGDALRFTMRLQHITFVTNARVKVKKTATRGGGGGGKVKLGTKVVSYRGPKTVLWRKGIKFIGNAAFGRLRKVYVGGASLIGDSEYVHWLTHEELGDPGAVRDALAIHFKNIKDGNHQPIFDGAWYHGHLSFTGRGISDVQSTGAGSGKNGVRVPLTGEEYDRFLLDMARDREARSLPENDSYITKYLKRFDKEPDKTRKPINLNALNGRPILTGDAIPRGFKQ